MTSPPRSARQVAAPVGRVRLTGTSAAVALLTLVVLVFAAIRLVEDVPHLVAS